MPAIASGSVVGASDVVTDSDAFVDGGCSSPALAAGVTYLAIGLANHRNEGGGSWGSEVEARFGATRIALSRWLQLFGAFNSGDAAAGGMLACVAIVTGNGSDTLNMRVRSTGAGASSGENARIGDQSWVWIALDELTYGSDYVAAASLNSDSASVTPASTAWVEGSADGRATIDNVIDDETWLVIASAEGVSTSDGDGEFRARLRATFDPEGTPTPISISPADFRLQTTAESTEFGPHAMCIALLDLAADDVVEIGWEFAEQDGGAGTHGWRRERVIAIRLPAFVDYAEISNAGNIIANGGTTEGANALTWTPSESGDVLVLASAAYQNGGTWGEGRLRLDGSPDVDHPPDGRMYGVINTGTGASSDLALLTFCARVEDVSGAQTWRLAATADSSVDLTIGRNAGNTAPATTPLVAILLATPGAGGTTAEGSGGSPGSSSGNGTGLAVASGEGSAAGSSAATGVVSATASGAGAAPGSAAVAGSAGATVRGSGAAPGDAAGSGGSVATAAGSGAAAGSATATGISEVDGSASGAAAGSSSATAEGVRAIFGSGASSGAGAGAGAAVGVARGSGGVSALAAAAALAVTVASGSGSAVASSSSEGTGPNEGWLDAFLASGRARATSSTTDGFTSAGLAGEGYSSATSGGGTTSDE